MSSYFDEASLVMIPSGYKDQKVYSIKPLDGSGDLTFSRASSATRVASNGLIEKVRTNLALQSQTFDNASWTKSNITVTANSTTAPDGTTTADTILAPLASGNAIYQTISSEGILTLSVYAKANTSNFVFIDIFDFSPAVDYVAIFNLSNGTYVGNGGASSVDSYSIVSAGNGWYRISATKNVGASGNHNYILGVANGNSTTPSANTSVYAWGAQVEVSDFGATDYIATTSAAVSVGPVSGLPRLDYLNSSCPRLLLEPQRTNVLTFSEQLNNAAWNNTLYPVTITANQTASPSGYVDADLLTPTAALSRHAVGESASGTAGTVYTASAFFKKGGSRYVVLTDGGDAVWHIVTADLDTATITNQTNATGTITNYGNGWYRVTCTFTRTNTSTIDIWVGASNTASAVALPSFNDVTLTTYAWGIQLEAGAYATSYIPTLGTSVTRVVDYAAKGGIGSLLPSQTGTIYVEFDWQRTPNDVQVLSIHNNSTGLAWIAKQSSTGVQGTYFASGYIGTVNGTISASSGIVKVAYAWTNGSQALYVNGVQMGTATDAISDSNDLSILELNGFWGITKGGSAIAQALVFNSRLSNSDLAALTA